MNRCTLEKTEFLIALVAIFCNLYLSHYAYALHEEHETEYRDEQFLVDDYCRNSDDTTDCQRTCIAHKHLSRIGIVPKETNHGTYESTKEYHQLLRVGDIHDVEVGGVANV